MYYMMLTMANILFLLLIISVSNQVFSEEIACKDEEGNSVDWFINYKLPKLEERTDLIGEGFAYAYLSSSKRSSKWTLSTQNISSPSSMMGYTMREFYKNKQALTYLLYNDNHPGAETSSGGHTKGIVMFDSNTGLWIIHSIPKFPADDAYGYPSNAVENGQSVLCISFKTVSLNEIGKELLYNGPSIYAKNLNIEGLDPDVQSLFSSKPSFVRKAPFSRITRVKSSKGKIFTIFAKDNQFNKDLYSELIAPELMTSLFVESWRRGSGTPSDPSCDLSQKVLDVQSIRMSFGSRKRSIDVRFPSTEDHSKWAISMNSTLKWVCVGDINRMESQKKRGGGAACFSFSRVWQAFNSSIDSTDNCHMR